MTVNSEYTSADFRKSSEFTMQSTHTYKHVVLMAISQEACISRLLFDSILYWSLFTDGEITG